MLLDKRDEFIESNIGLVHSCCRRFAGRSIEYDDLFQAGCVGLVKAARDFDESRGFMFSTYAVPVILGEIKRLFRDTGDIKVSRSLKELSLKVTAKREAYEKLHGVSPTVEELSLLLAVPAQDITQALCVAQPVLSLTYEDDDGTKELDIPTVDHREEWTNRLLVAQAFDGIDEKEKKLIFLRYFTGLTQAEVAKKLGMTQVQVSRSEKKLLAKMRQKLSE